MKTFIEHNYPTIKNKAPSIFKFDRRLRIFIKKFHYDNKRENLLKNINLNIYKDNKIGKLDQVAQERDTNRYNCGLQKLNHGVVESEKIYTFQFRRLAKKYRIYSTKNSYFKSIFKR